MVLPLLTIKDLHAQVNDNPVLKGLNLTLKPGEVHAIMGPNGSGKSTLAKIMGGHPDYEVTAGEVIYSYHNKQENLLELAPYERAQKGIFLGMQYPVEVPGVSNLTFLRESFNEICKSQGVDPMDSYDFQEFLQKKMQLLDMDARFLHRFVNEGFSGGEKKKNEILQLLLLNPSVAFLDETDSGLDIDALKIVSKGIETFRSKRNCTVLITHYQRLLNYIKPDFIHVLYGGKIIKSGGPEMALELEAKGYDHLIAEADGRSQA